MSKPTRLQQKWLVFLSIVFLSVTFLMGDFCEDVTSVPVEMHYPATEDSSGDDGLVEVVIDFVERADEEDMDGDGEIPDDTDMDGDAEMPEDEEIVLLEERFCPNMFSIGLHHHTVDLTKSNKLLQGGADALKKKLVGVFIRSVTYGIQSNTIPTALPPLKVYISRKYQGYEDEDGNEMDWDAIDPATLKRSDTGIADEDLVLMGTIEPIYYDYPTTQVFPSVDKILDRQEANLDLLSQTITDSFAFEVVITAEEEVCVEDQYREEIQNRDDPRGILQLKLGMVVIAVIKPL